MYQLRWQKKWRRGRCKTQEDEEEEKKRRWCEESTDGGVCIRSLQFAAVSEWNLKTFPDNWKRLSKRVLKLLDPERNDGGTISRRHPGMAPFFSAFENTDE